MPNFVFAHLSICWLNLFPKPNLFTGHFILCQYRVELQRKLWVNHLWCFLFFMLELTNSFHLSSSSFMAAINHRYCVLYGSKQEATIVNKLWVLRAIFGWCLIGFEPSFMQASNQFYNKWYQRCYVTTQVSVIKSLAYVLSGLGGTRLTYPSRLSVTSLKTRNHNLSFK